MSEKQAAIERVSSEQRIRDAARKAIDTYDADHRDDWSEDTVYAMNMLEAALTHPSQADDLREAVRLLEIAKGWIGVSAHGRTRSCASFRRSIDAFLARTSRHEATGRGE